ncbi:MAG: hypothetical protein ACREIT_03615, partial [Tepidisphaeraceae bacterium]
MPPTLLLAALTSLRRRLKLLGIVYGLGVLVASVVLVALGVVLVDYVLHLPGVLRLVVLVACLAGFGYAVWRWIARPALSRLTIGDVAGHVEQAFPQFDDRLRSTVLFTQQPDVPGSDVMKQRVITEAGDIARRVDFNRAIVTKPVWQATAAGLGAIVLAGALALGLPDLMRIGLTRLLTPLADVAWPKRFQIDLMGDVPTRVPVGQRVNLKMQLLKGNTSKAVVLYQYGNGSVQKELMTRADDGSFAASLDAKADSGQLKAWIEAGDDRATVRPITIVPRLTIQRVEAVITPPAYAGLAATTFDLSAAPALATVGADVQLRVSFNKPLDPAKPVAILPVTETMQAPQATADLSDASIAALRWQAQDSLRFHVRATDTDGFANPALEEYEVIVRPDQNPTVQIENPRRNEERTAVAVVPLQAAAEDDYAINSLKLVVDRLGERKGHWEIELVKEAGATNGAAWNRVDGASDRQRFRLNYDWDLAQLADADLQPGDVLEYHCVVQDNFALNGATHAPVPSGKLRIAIISQEDLANRITDELRNIANHVADLRTAQTRTREETGTLADDTKDKPRLDEADKQVASRLANQQSTVASQSKQVAGKLDEVLDRLDENKSDAQELKDIAKDVRDTMNRSAENPMKDAAGQINAAKESKTADPKQRGEQLDKAQKNQQKAADDLSKALDRMGNIGTLQRTIDAVRDILEDQQRVAKETAEVGKNNLGKKPEDMSPEDRKKIDDLANEQKTLSDRTKKTVKEMRKTADQMQKSDPTSAQA